MEFTSQNGAIQGWKTFQINELGQRSEFTRMETIKLTSNVINTCFNIKALEGNNQLLGSSPLHDNWL